MRIDFDEREHCYAVDGEIAKISVTELLHKQGIAPDYGKVDKKTLEKNASIGKAIHKDCELLINSTDHECETECGKAFDEWQKEHISCATAEQMLAYDYDGMVIAGTCDLIGFLRDGTPFIADHKVTSKLNRDYVSWQVSILDYMARHLTGQTINRHAWNWNGAKCFYCFHYDKNAGTMKCVKLDKIADTEIERLFEAEYKEEVYTPLKLIISRQEREEIKKAEDLLVEIEEQYKQAKANAEEWRQKLYQKFEEQGIDTWEYKGTKFTKMPATDSIVVDTKTLKSEYPNIYSNCTKVSKKRGYIRVTHKGDEEL